MGPVIGIRPAVTRVISEPSHLFFRISCSLMTISNSFAADFLEVPNPIFAVVLVMGIIQAKKSGAYF